MKSLCVVVFHDVVVQLQFKVEAHWTEHPSKKALQVA